MNQKVENLKGKLIVSCQALSNEPLHSSFIMGRMALAAKQGGASGIRANTKEDMYTTLDIQILDLFAGNMEFIKSGACPTFVKRNKEVQLLKSITLPTGIVEKNELIVYDYDLENGDILVMCSDGVIDSNTEYINKELWVKYLLEDISVDDAQQIANMVLNEAIDNEFGMKKDDMTVIVAKVNKKT